MNNSLLFNIDISRLNNGNGLVDITCLPKWHKACYVLCNAGKTARAKNFLILQCKQHLSSTSAPTRSMKTDSDDELAWFFCDDTTGNLTKVETVSLDSHVRQIAEVLRDTKLLAKLSGGDMVAFDDQYHLRRFDSILWQRKISKNTLEWSTPHHINANALAFAEVVSYIKKYGQIGGDLNVFEISYIKKLYCYFLQKIDLQRKFKIIFQHLNLIIASLVLSFRKDVGDALLDACNFDFDDEAMKLMRVAKLVRKVIFETNYHFSGSLCDDQYNWQPTSLAALVRIILCDANTKQIIYDLEIRPAATSQLLVFSATKQSRADSVAVRHNLDRETSSIVSRPAHPQQNMQTGYLIDNLFERGLSVSYGRALQLSTEEANTPIDRYENEGCVCSTTLIDKLFTAGNLDNIDHNPSSTSSQSWHCNIHHKACHKW